MSGTQSGVLSIPTLRELNTLMEKRRSELKELKDGRLKAENLVSKARTNFSLEDTGTPSAIKIQDGFSTPFYNVSGGSIQVSDHQALESAPPATFEKVFYSERRQSSNQVWECTTSDMASENGFKEEICSVQNVSDDSKQQITSSPSLNEAREEIDELRLFSSNLRNDLDVNESLTALRSKMDEYDEIDHVTREADEQMLQLCDNLARSKQELEIAQQQVTAISNDVEMKREENLSLSRQLHDSLKRVEEFEVAMSEEKEEWHDNQRSITAAGIEQEMVEIRKKLALEKQKNKIILAKGVAAAQQGSQHRQYCKPSLLHVALVLVGWGGALCCTGLLVISGKFSSCSVDIVRLAY